MVLVKNIRLVFYLMMIWSKIKNFGFWNRMYSLFNVMAKASQYNKTLSHYNVSFSNSKGNNLIYDSETDKIIDGDSEEEEQDEEKKEE